MINEQGVKYSIHNGRKYYSRSHAASYVGMTDSGFRRKMKKMEDEEGIILPMVTLPSSMQHKFIDERILNIFRKSIVVGREKEWYEELKAIVQEVMSES